MSESILSLSEFKAEASRLLDQIRADPATLVLTQNGRARAVLDRLQTEVDDDTTDPGHAE